MTDSDSNSDDCPTYHCCYITVNMRDSDPDPSRCHKDSDDCIGRACFNCKIWICRWHPEYRYCPCGNWTKKYDATDTAAKDRTETSSSQSEDE